jgi:hypothetical protein
MTEVDRARCRRAAKECIELARSTFDPETKQILLTRAQEWLKLAYSEHDAEFVGLLAEFNTRQMAVASPVRRQQVQQQQQKNSVRKRR